MVGTPKTFGANGLWDRPIPVVGRPIRCARASTAIVSQRHSLSRFRRLISKIIEDDAAHDHLPDYTMSIESDNVVFRPKGAEAVVAPPFLALRFRKPDTHDEARRLAPGWDVYVLENEWRSWVHDKAIDVKDADKHFLAFCNKRGAYQN